MQPERLEQIEQLFHAALHVEKSQRADFLREACRNDEFLRREVESLLASRSKAETFIEGPEEGVALLLARIRFRRRPQKGLRRRPQKRLSWSVTISGAVRDVGCPPISAAIAS